MTAIRSIRSWSFQRAVLGRRTLPALAVALLPAFIVAIGAWNGAWDGKRDAFDDFGFSIAPLCLYFVLPMLCMFSVLPTVGELYESSAISYFWTRPTPRWKVLLGIHQGSLLAFLSLTALGITAVVLIMAFANSNSNPPGDWMQRAFGLWLVMGVGGATYGATCLFFAVWSKRSALWSIGVLIGWGAIVGALPGSLRNTSPHRYLFGLLRDWCGIENVKSGFFDPDPSPPSAWLSLLVLGGLVTIALFGSFAAANRRDVN